jgi:predicted O-methyltransferase YrrM
MFEKGKYEKIGYELFLEQPRFQEKYESLANPFEISFLLGLIDKFQFSTGRKIDTVLEIGVFNGVTSLYMLKTGAKRESFHLYGIDIGEGEFFGQAVFNEAEKEELAHYHLHRNSTSFDIEKVIDGKIDMVFIDGGHAHPHPLIDLLYVIPFLHDESIVLLHDVVDYMRPNAWGESFIFCGWKDEKYRNVLLDSTLQAAGDTMLGCIKIPANKKKLYDDILEIVRIPFRAAPWKFDEYYLGINETHLDNLKQFMERYYDKEFAQTVFSQFQSNLSEYKRNWLLYLHETKFFNFLFEGYKFLINRPPHRAQYDGLYTLKIIQKMEKILKKIVRCFIKKR